MAQQVLIELCFCTGSAGGWGSAREGVEAAVAHGGSQGPLQCDRHLHQLLYQALALPQMHVIKVMVRLGLKTTELCREVELCFPQSYYFINNKPPGSGVLVHGASEQHQHEHGVMGTSWGKGGPGQGQVLGTAGHAVLQRRAGRTCSGQAGHADIEMQTCCPQDVGHARARL